MDNLWSGRVFNAWRRLEKIPVVLQCNANELATSTHTALREQLLKGVLHGTFRDLELCCYLFIGQALNQEAEDIQLPIT